MPRCSAIIVTYNSVESMVPCLQALAHEDCEIVVVDNNSQDDTVRRAQGVAGIASLQVIRISRNIGFGAAVNQGVRAASGDVLLILNPDAIAEPGAVSALMRCIGAAAAAAAGGALLESDGQPQRGFVFRTLPTLSTLICEVLLINQLWPNNPVNRHYRCLDADYSRPQEVEQPAGACLAITREAFDAVRGFDPLFSPVWFEDVDLCKRLIDGGGKIVYCPSARFRHSGAHSVGKMAFDEKQRYWYENMLRYAGKHFSHWQRFVLRIGIVKGMLLRSIATLFGRGPAEVSKGDAIAAYWHVCRIALGLTGSSYAVRTKQ